MNTLSGVSSFFGLDIGTTAVRLVELNSATGTHRGLERYAYVPVDIKVAQSDSKIDQHKLAEVVASLVKESKVGSKNVAVGLPSAKVFNTVIDFDRLSPEEMDKAIHYQADSIIPTPPAESKIDWAVLGDSPKDKTKVEVLVSSVANKFIEQRLEMLESIGLNVIAFEPDSLSLVRALVPAGTPGAQLVFDLGHNGSDLVITMGDAPRLMRSLPTGMESIFKAAAQNLGVDDTQARQFVGKFGLIKDKLEGQVYESIINTVDMLVNEVDKSIKFFQNRYPQVSIDRIIVTGGAAIIPEFPLYLANHFGMNVEIGNAWRNVGFSSDRAAELGAVSNQFSIASGLAQRIER